MPEATSRTYKLPNLLEDWPWERNLCPDYPELKKASTAWIESYKLFSPKEQTIFNLCDFGTHYSVLWLERAVNFSLKRTLRMFDLLIPR